MPRARDTRLALAGAGALAAAMGIGRFAYTALLPSAQRALGLDDRAAGLVASANLAGYLAGVLLARAAPPARRTFALRVGLVTVVAATAATAIPAGFAAWTVIRVAAGVASGLVFVLGSALVLEAASDRGRTGALLFVGVGAGIATSGVVAALGGGAGWQPPWVVLAALALALVVPAWLALPARSAVPSAAAPLAASAPPPVPARRLAAAYFLEGMGYIVSGTFCVAAAQRIPEVAPHASWVWVVAGLAAMPSVPIWMRAGGAAGERPRLALAFLVQAAGMALPAVSRSAVAAVAGAALFGGTFMGITALTMSAVGKLDPARPGRGIATLTALYGVGQILGPTLAGALSRRLGDPRPAVLAAAAAVALGGVVIGFPARRRVTAEEEATCRTST